MHKYKVVFHESQILKQLKNYGQVDGLTTANELEALMIEYDGKGYDLVSISPIHGVPGSPVTSGFMITFKKRKAPGTN